jgi:hypothetical protein
MYGSKFIAIKIKVILIHANLIKFFQNNKAASRCGQLAQSATRLCVSGAPTDAFD